MEKIKTNRKTTKGRNIYFQNVEKLKTNQIGESMLINTSIKHIQVSSKKLRVTPTMINVYDYLNRRVESTNPNTIKKKTEKQRVGKLLWDSKSNGTYVRKLHGELN